MNINEGGYIFNRIYPGEPDITTVNQINDKLKKNDYTFTGKFLNILEKYYLVNDYTAFDNLIKQTFSCTSFVIINNENYVIYNHSEKNPEKTVLKFDDNMRVISANVNINDIIFDNEFAPFNYISDINGAEYTDVEKLIKLEYFDSKIFAATDLIKLVIDQEETKKITKDLYGALGTLSKIDNVINDLISSSSIRLFVDLLYDPKIHADVVKIYNVIRYKNQNNFDNFKSAYYTNHEDYVKNIKKKIKELNVDYENIQFNDIFNAGDPLDKICLAVLNKLKVNYTKMSMLSAIKKPIELRKNDKVYIKQLTQTITKNISTSLNKNVEKLITQNISNPELVYSMQCDKLSVNCKNVLNTEKLITDLKDDIDKNLESAIKHMRTDFTDNIQNQAEEIKKPLVAYFLETVIDAVDYLMRIKFVNIYCESYNLGNIILYNYIDTYLLSSPQFVNKMFILKTLGINLYKQGDDPKERKIFSTIDFETYTGDNAGSNGDCLEITILDFMRLILSDKNGNIDQEKIKILKNADIHNFFMGSRTRYAIRSHIDEYKNIINIAKNIIPEFSYKAAYSEQTKVSLSACGINLFIFIYYFVNNKIPETFDDQFIKTFFSELITQNGFETITFNFENASASGIPFISINNKYNFGMPARCGGSSHALCSIIRENIFRNIPSDNYMANSFFNIIKSAAVVNMSPYMKYIALLIYINSKVSATKLDDIFDKKFTTYILQNKYIDFFNLFFSNTGMTFLCQLKIKRKTFEEDETVTELLTKLSDFLTEVLKKSSQKITFVKIFPDSDYDISISRALLAPLNSYMKYIKGNKDFVVNTFNNNITYKASTTNSKYYKLLSFDNNQFVINDYNSGASISDIKSIANIIDPSITVNETLSLNKFDLQKLYIEQIVNKLNDPSYEKMELLDTVIIYSGYMYDKYIDVEGNKFIGSSVPTKFDCRVMSAVSGIFSQIEQASGRNIYMGVNKIVKKHVNPKYYTVKGNKVEGIDVYTYVSTMEWLRALVEYLNMSDMTIRKIFDKEITGDSLMIIKQGDKYVADPKISIYYDTKITINSQSEIKSGGFNLDYNSNDKYYYKYMKYKAKYMNNIKK